jgi:hypothetical protein
VQREQWGRPCNLTSGVKELLGKVGLIRLSFQGADVIRGTSEGEREGRSRREWGEERRMALGQLYV